MRARAPATERLSVQRLLGSSVSQMSWPELFVDCGCLALEVSRPNNLYSARTSLQHFPAGDIQPNPRDLAKPCLRAGEDHPADARPVDRAGAHRAGLGARIEGAAAQKRGVVMLSRKLHGSGQNMGVMRGVFCLRRSADHRELRPL